MDELDYRILEVLQNEFPLSERPYKAISEKLKITCDRLMLRIESLMADRVIRRIKASLNSRNLGYCSTLTAISVDDGIVEQSSEIIEVFAEITHSYLRNNLFNI